MNSYHHSKIRQISFGHLVLVCLALHTTSSLTGQRKLSPKSLNNFSSMVGSLKLSDTNFFVALFISSVTTGLKAGAAGFYSDFH